MDIEDLSIKTSAWAEKIEHINAVILFGSRAKGTSTESSDWDICCILNHSNKCDWYGTWFHEADEWKRQFCTVTNLPFNKVQFTAPTSSQVKNGLFECSKVLYVQTNKNT